MLNSIQTESIVGTESPTIYIKSVETEYIKNNSLRLKVYYYVLDMQEISWIDKTNIINNLKFNFLFKNPSGILLKHFNTNFSPTFSQINTKNLSDYPKTIIGEDEYYIFHDYFEVIINNVEPDYSINLEYHSEISELLKSEIKTLNISKIPITYYLTQNDNVFIDPVFMTKDGIVSKYDLSYKLVQKPIYNNLFKNYSVFNVVEQQLRSGETEDNDYFTLFKINQTGYGNVKGLVGINLQNIVLNNCFFSKYYSFKEVIKEIIKNTDYKISVYRSKVKPQKYMNQDQNIDGRVLVATLNYDKKENGLIKELLGMRGFNGSYKFFTFNDLGIKNEKKGNYKYTVEFSIIDNSKEIYENIFIDKINSLMNIINEYLMDLRHNTIGNSGFIKDSFYDQYFIKKYNSGDYDLMVWISSISKLYSLIYGPSRQFKEFCMSVLNPSSCNIKDVERIIKFVNEKIISKINAYPKNSSTTGGEIVFSKTYNDIEQIIEKTDNLVGTEFISTLSEKTIADVETKSFGFNEYSINVFESRLAREYSKYSNSNIINKLFKRLQTLSPAVLFINDKSFSIYDRNLIPANYNDILYQYFGNINKLEDFYNKYQSEFYQLMNEGIYLKNITTKQKIRKDPNSNDILFDNTLLTGDASKQYIVNTGMTDFYISYRYAQLAPEFINLNNELSSTFQYQQLQNADTNSRMVAAGIDTNNFSTLFFNHFDLAKIKLILNKEVDFTNSETNFSSNIEKYRYTLCKIERLSNAEPFKNTKIFNEYFLVDNGTSDIFSTSDGVGFFDKLTINDSEDRNSFYQNFVKPEYIVNYIPKIEIASVDKSDYYLNKKINNKQDLIIKGI